VNRPDLSLKAAGLSATINVILNVLLIPRFGILGAATATAVSLMTMALIFYSLTIKTISLKARIRWMIEVAGITSLAIIIFVIFAASINSNALRIGILLAFSILSLIILIEKDEIELLKSSLMALKKKI
jgi:O-antigen/teichoic acid export membrane protein